MRARGTCEPPQKKILALATLASLEHNNEIDFIAHAVVAVYPRTRLTTYASTVFRFVPVGRFTLFFLCFLLKIRPFIPPLDVCCSFSAGHLAVWVLSHAARHPFAFYCRRNRRRRDSRRPAWCDLCGYGIPVFFLFVCLPAFRAQMELASLTIMLDHCRACPRSDQLPWWCVDPRACASYIPTHSFLFFLPVLRALLAVVSAASRLRVACRRVASGSSTACRSGSLRADVRVFHLDYARTLLSGFPLPALVVNRRARWIVRAAFCTARVFSACSAAPLCTCWPSWPQRYAGPSVVCVVCVV